MNAEGSKDQFIGKRLPVYAISMNLMPSCEGEAEIIEKLERDNLYLVRFDDGAVEERYVFEEA